MKRNFIAGLVFLLPVVLTVLIVTFLINLVTKPFVGTVATALNHYQVLNKPFFFMTGTQVLMLSSKIIVIVGAISVILLIGFFSEVFLLHSIRKAGDYIMQRIPMIKSIYKATHDVAFTLFGKKEESKLSFSSVVLVPFPSSETYNIGFITSGSLPKESDMKHQELISVFVPGTPNPMMGFMLLFNKSQLIALDIKVEDALKFIVSCGVVYPESLSNLPVLEQDVAAK